MKFEEWWEGWLKWDKARQDAGLPEDNKFDLARSCWKAAIRAGQEEMREKAIKVFRLGYPRDVYAELPLEGDDDD